jgi:hypothetical protein
MADDLDLNRPVGVDPQSWTAIESNRDRLKEALHGTDRSLVLGRAKEFAESVARVVIIERGEVAPSSCDFPQLVDSAHAVLKRQPGTDLSNDSELRILVQSAMKIVKNVGTIRNSFGSGHGRAREPLVAQEMVDGRSDDALGPLGTGPAGTTDTGPTHQPNERPARRDNVLRGEPRRAPADSQHR